MFRVRIFAVQHSRQSKSIVMNRYNRRVFLGMSAGALAVTMPDRGALAAIQCVTGSYPGFLPTRLSVDCASKQNFRLFRQNADYMGLAGAVSMTFVRGKLGSYDAGNLFLFPWLKPKGLAFGAAKAWNAVMPTNATTVRAAAPIPGSNLPQDEYFCNVVLQAPSSMFIGFAADVPFSSLEAKLGLYSNVDKLADGKPLGIDWASSNLNNPWFGGSRAIPDTEDCNGAAWRKLIIDGLNQASASAC
jgi:hypothetical protein